MKNINQYICDYMNTMGTGGREYTLEEVNKIKRSVLLEKEDRTKNNLVINFNSPNGRKVINNRTTIISNTLFKLDVTIKDITLFRKCKSREAKDRKLSNNLEDD